MGYLKPPIYIYIYIYIQYCAKVLGHKYHSTETALLKVLNDILLTGDAGDHAVLVLLDLSAAFDTVDHAILLARLEHCVGIKGSALKWFK